MADDEKVTGADPTGGKILVTGATGDIGGHLVQALVDSEASFAVMCRRDEQREAFRARGIEAVAGDFADPRSLRTAFEGFGQIFLLAPESRVQYDQDRAAISAAANVGVSHLLKVSTADANPDSRIPWARDHGRADIHLAQSGMRWTRLAPGAFTKNLLELSSAIRLGLMPGTSGHGATTWIDVRDIAEVAARILTQADLQGGTEGRSYLLTGTHPLSFPQIAEILSEELGRKIRYIHLPGPLMFAALLASGVPAWMAAGLVRQFVDVVRRGADMGRVHSSDLEDLLGRAPRGIEDLVDAHSGHFGSRI